MLQKRETLTEANLSFVRWLDPPHSIVFADDENDPSYHVYIRNDMARRVIIYDGHRFAFQRLASVEEAKRWEAEMIEPIDSIATQGE